MKQGRAITQSLLSTFGGQGRTFHDRLQCRGHCYHHSPNSIQGGPPLCEVKIVPSSDTARLAHTASAQPTAVTLFAPCKRMPSATNYRPWNLVYSLKTPLFLSCLPSHHQHPHHLKGRREPTFLFKEVKVSRKRSSRPHGRCERQS
jgi:hypothetical protein